MSENNDEKNRVRLRIHLREVKRLSALLPLARGVDGICFGLVDGIITIRESGVIKLSQTALNAAERELGVANMVTNVAEHIAERFGISLLEIDKANRRATDG